MGDIVKAIVRRSGKLHYLSREISLFVFQNGWSKLANNVGKDNCYILMPLVSTGSCEVTVEEQSTGRRTTARLDVGFKLMLSGRSLLWLPPQSSVVCVVLGAGMDKGEKCDGKI